MSNFVYLGGQKGGTTKTATAHLLCLGAILHSQPAAYVVTDPHRQVKADGRPYGVLDGRDPANLAQIIATSQTTQNGWLVIDGGGNRPAFDAELAAEADLCLLPFRPSEEDLDTVALDLASLPHALAWPSAWPTNHHAQAAAQYLIDGLAKAFPLRVVSPPIYFVNAVSELLGATLDSPSTPVRSAARRTFRIMADYFDTHSKAAPTVADTRAVSA
jgi:chromosome partitioning protein